jgi:hypothetical protein
MGVEYAVEESILNFHISFIFIQKYKSESEWSINYGPYSCG